MPYETQPHPIDIHVGERLKQRRVLLGISQEKLGDAVGVKFQQIQKYEKGFNRISASRLWNIANALEVPVGHFYEGMSQDLKDKHGEGYSKTFDNASGAFEVPPGEIPHDVLNDPKMLRLVSAVSRLSAAVQKRVFDLADSLAKNYSDSLHRDL